MGRKLFFLALILAGAVGFALAIGNFQWRWASDQLRKQLLESGHRATRGTYDPRELAGLPAPVIRYFAASLTPGQPLIASAILRSRGAMSLDTTATRWVPFQAEQTIMSQPPGFFWDARVRAMAWPATFVRDAYVEGIGVLQASIGGVVPVVNQRGRGELARGELMRYLAEAAWIPTKLLPSQGVRWAAVDDSTADAEMVDRELQIFLRFRFDDTGGIREVSSEVRPRMLGTTFVPMRWGGRFWNHAKRGGMRIPLDAEVAWRGPGGEQPYWRGHMEQANYQFAEQ